MKRKTEQKKKKKKENKKTNKIFLQSQPFPIHSMYIILRTTNERTLNKRKQTIDKRKKKNEEKNCVGYFLGG
jgi:hypothetical protein